MVDPEKHISYWRNGADEDWDVAVDLIARGKTRHGLFFAHLSLEKLLKALICRHTSDLAPRIHNLVRLAELAGLKPNQRQLDILSEMNAFQLEGRYPEGVSLSPQPKEAETYLQRSREVLEWLKREL